VPKQMLTLNDFSGGLNTKSSPRDIALNELAGMTNALVNVPGLIRTAKFPTDIVSGSTSLNHAARGNGLFSFNSQYDIGRTTGAREDYESSVEVLAYPDGTNIKFYTRAYNATGNFTHQGTDNQIALGGSTNVEPVYYFVDGSLYISDKKVVSGTANSNPKVLQFVTKDRFGQSVAKFISGEAKVADTADNLANFSDADTFSATLDQDGEFELIYDKGASGGGWEADTYEFTYTFVDYTGDETLPHVFSSPHTCILTAGQFFEDIGFKINTTNAFRESEKGVRIYVRAQNSNERYQLLLDVDYERGVRTNLFDDYKAWSTSGTYASGSTANASVTGVSAQSPALDTYESINGYSQDEDRLGFGTIGGFKGAAVCSRRAWVCNVRIDDEIFDDRIYYTPVNRFKTFPTSFFLDIGINDGDSFNALSSVGNRILAFKQNKLYIINVSSSSDAGWYLEAEYEGMGCKHPEAIVKTAFGVCWTNEYGVYLFNGEAPIELTLKLDDENWNSFTLGKIPSIGYNNINKQLVVFQNTESGTDGTNAFMVYDFNTKSIFFQNRQNVVSVDGMKGMSNLVSTVGGMFFSEYAHSGNNKSIRSLSSGELGGSFLDITTKDIDFGEPGKIKKIYKVYVTAKDDGSSAGIVLKTSLNGNPSSFTTTETVDIDSSSYKTLVYTVNQDCESIQLRLQGADTTNELTINDITIEYRVKYKRAS
jgi:hypothetical protein